MRTNTYKPDITEQLSPFLVVFLIHASQIGEGILSFERFIAEKAGHDSWVSVLLTGGILCLIIYLIYKIVLRGDGDLIKIHQDLFGKWIGNVMTILVGCYFLILSIIVTRSYIEVIQVWMFPELSTFWFSAVIAFLFYTFIIGGFRIVAGLAFFSVILSTLLASFKYVAYTEGYWTNLFPMFDHSPIEIMQAIKPMFYSYLGVELLLIYLPFIKNKKQSLKWAILGNLWSTLVYFVSVIAIFLYFNQDQLQHIVWPTLNLWKVINLPFVERFEYIGVTLHFTVVIATICLYLWAAAQTFFRISNRGYKVITIIILVMTVVGCNTVDNFVLIEQYTTQISYVGYYLVIIYIPFLYIYQSIWLGVKK
ncbi:spore germination protein [Aquibacillus koreensis]|uniref:Spore germination protein n=1 Tax=Aquibacillus koreensis TaxID=279446 RepID=A0A9X4AHB0_9BACI|nr:spore germination protein [Aquibacillus koreensis]MCT2537085.1 spore germination protein [Aquibacillus koreensis]MDC3419932.1 spore germination protein [Aquibacillus koreensis]